MQRNNDMKYPCTQTALLKLEDHFFDRLAVLLGLKRPNYFLLSVWYIVDAL